MKRLVSLMVLAVGFNTTIQAATPSVSEFFFNKKADIKSAHLGGDSGSQAKWMVATPSTYQVFVEIPGDASATSAVYRIYPQGKSSSSDCTSTASNPCYEVTVNQSANQGKEIQLTTGDKTTWKFTSKGYVSVSATNLNDTEMLGIGRVRFTEQDKEQSFSKISNMGKKLPDSAALGSDAKDWACTKDNNTGLIWEVLTNDGGLRDAGNTYSWYNPKSSTNGGFPGYQNLGECTGGISCDTEGYVNAVNAAKLCGFHDWRLPRVKELMNIMAPSYLNYATGTGGINPDYFPNTHIDRHWASETSDENIVQGRFVIVTDAYGHSPKRFGKGLFRVRLVRGN